jgi:penicillin-binding protein 2
MKEMRIFLIHIIVSVLILVLLLRLFYIQVLDRSFYLKKAESQWNGSLIDTANGDIYDRYGKSLTGSYYESYAIISPRWLTPLQKKSLFEKHVINSMDGEKPQIVRITPENTGIIRDLEGKTPGIFLYKKKIEYGPSALATHVVGYKSKTGIEKTFEKVLSSTGTKNTILYDGFGQPIPGISQKKNESSSGIQLAIDSKIQEIVEQIMDDEVPRGAVVILDAKTGDILSMASRPNYKQYCIEDYLNREDAPLINRAVEAFSPGSIFKIVVLSAALEENLASLDDRFYCPGFIKVGGILFKCGSYDKGGHGEITLKEAVARSCNTVFIQLGLSLGKQKLIEYAKKFGLGQKVLMDLPEEKTGFIPEIQKVYYQDIGNISIGQGPILITPLQAAQMVSIIANGGILIKPHLTTGVVESDGNTIPFDHGKDAVRVISEETASKVKEALEEVTKYGTGVNAMPLLPIGKTAGKTGTAEFGNKKYHAWFVGYFPTESPRYIISVFIENGGSGPAKAAPVFREIVEKLNINK